MNNLAHDDSPRTENPAAAPSPEAIAIELHQAFPAYRVTVRRDGREPRFQLIATDDRYPRCLISSDPGEIHTVLNGDT